MCAIDDIQERPTQLYTDTHIYILFQFLTMVLVWNSQKNNTMIDSISHPHYFHIDYNIEN